LSGDDKDPCSDALRNATLSSLSATPLNLRLFSCLVKDVVRHGVPSIVNANKQEQQRRSANEEQDWARMGESHVCRSSQHGIRRTWKHNMK
jgi:hypothetical protein